MEKQYEEVLSNFCDHGDIGKLSLQVFTLKSFPSCIKVSFLMLGDDWCVEEVSQAIITWVKSNVDFADPILRYCVNFCKIQQCICHFIIIFRL